MRDTLLMAKWFEDVGRRVRERLKDLEEDALEWRAYDRWNNVRETVWHMARWIDVLTRILGGTQPSTERWFTDGWAERTGYDPRGIGDDGLGALTGYTFQEVLAIRRLNATELVRYLDSVVGPHAQHLSALPADAAAPTHTLRAPGNLEGRHRYLGTLATH